MRSRKGSAIPWVGLALLLSGLLFLGAVRVKALQCRYEISRLQSQRDRLLKEKKELELELAMLTSPEEVERRAKEELGMVHPDPSRVMVLGGGR